MGKPSDCLQKVQLLERGQDSGRSWDGDQAKSIMERAITAHLRRLGRNVLRNDYDLLGVGIDPDIFNLIFKGWTVVEVDSCGVRVEFCNLIR